MSWTSRRPGARGGLAILFALLALWSAGGAAYIKVKAVLAQVLLEEAWQRTVKGERHVRPWQWADTWPVARLSLPGGGALVVLEGASGRNLAFGPAHVSATPLPGRAGNSVIVGHRDTHFADLEILEEGDLILAELVDRRLRFRVREIAVVHESATDVMTDWGSETLTLVTCYPFDAVDPGTEYRFVVRAEQAAKAPG